jgi:AcrR family transcriptional regulator
MKSNSIKTVAATDPPDAEDGVEELQWGGRRAPKRSRRDAILRSVGNVLRDSRLSSLTMQDIAVELGITKGNLYYYFKDKQDILYQCHMRCMDISLAALHDVLNEDGSTEQKLRRLLVRHIGGILDDGFGGVLLTDLDNLSPIQRKRYVAKRDEFETGVRQLIDAGVQCGEFQCADIKLAGLAMLGAINWIPKWYRPDGPLSSTEIAAGLADMLMRSLRPDSPK